MRSRLLATSLALLLGTTAGAPARAGVAEGVEALEERVEAVGRSARDHLHAVPVLGDVARRVRVSGSWLGAWFAASDASQVGDRDFDTWDARLFVDVELARDVDAGGHRLVDALGVSFEWEFVRLGQRMDELGELYLDVQGLGGSRWLNVQLGRFQIPVGEAYLRFGKAWRDNPFLSNPVAGTWWWDEGVRLHGRSASGRFGYVASLSSGETDRNFALDGGGQATLKLIAEPAPWLRLSASALWSGRTGSDAEPANAALWLGEAWARGFGSGSPVPNVAGGRVVPDGPGRLDGTLYLGADAVLTHPRGARLWLSYGGYRIDSSGGSRYDRTLHGWIAELLLEGRLLLPELSRFHLALRASGLGTYDRDEGYLLDVRYTVPFGYSMRSLEAYSVAAGWRVSRWADLKIEYTWQDVDVVRGAGRVGLADAESHWLGLGLGVHF